MPRIGQVKKTTLARTILLITAVAWLALVIIGSLQPVRPFFVQRFHRELHWFAFAGAAVLLFSLSKTRRQELLSGIAVFLIGLSLEVLQHRKNHYAFEWRDITDDGLAIMIAFWLYRAGGAPKSLRLAQVSRSIWRWLAKSFSQT